MPAPISSFGRTVLSLGFRSALISLSDAILSAVTQTENVTPRSHRRSYPPELLRRTQERGKIRVIPEAAIRSQAVINQNSLDVRALHEVPDRGEDRPNSRSHQSEEYVPLRLFGAPGSI